MSTNETPESILAWGRDTFGENSALDILVRANIEMAELVSAVSCGAAVELVAMEMADVDIVCAQGAAILGINPRIDPEGEHVVVGSLMSLALVAQSALSEIMSYVHLGDAAYEQSIADLYEDNLYWALRQLAQRLGVDLQEKRDEKMAINRARSWGKTPEGHFQHL